MTREKKTLYERLCSPKSLQRAWNGLNKSNPRSHGLSLETIQSFGSNLKSNLSQINQQLKSHTYTFSPFRGVVIRKTDRPNKPRPLRIPEVKDRVVLKAVANLIGPALEKKYYLKNPASFAYHKNLGPQQAIGRMVSLYRQQKPFVLEGDIIKFFDKVDRNYLLNDLVFPALPDSSLNPLIEEGLSIEIGNANSLTGDEFEAFEQSKGGIPQGCALSPLLSNVYLNRFDEKMLGERFGLVRYADDFIVLCNTEEEAQRAYQVACNVLEGELKLKIHPLDNESVNSKCRIVRPSQRPIEFLSVRFNGVTLSPSPKKIIELKDKIRYVTNPSSGLNVLEVLTKSNRLLEGWVAAFHFTDLNPHFVEIDEFINKQIVYCLRKLGWKLRGLSKSKDRDNILSTVQRQASGVRTCSEIYLMLKANEL